VVAIDDVHSAVPSGIPGPSSFGRLSPTSLAYRNLYIALLVLENLTAKIFKGSESYLLCGVPPVRFHLVARSVEQLVILWTAPNGLFGRGCSINDLPGRGRGPLRRLKSSISPRLGAGSDRNVVVSVFSIAVSYFARYSAIIHNNSVA
jgi:hypothetical protein